MQNDFSIVDTRIINSLLHKKPVDYIAMIIDMPIDAVMNKIKELITGTNRLPFDDKKHNQVLKEKALKENRKNLNAVYLKQRSERKNSVPKYQTRVVDYSQMITIRIDAKTCINVKAGTDVEKAKQQFFDTYKSFTQTAENPWQQIKKFK